MYTTQWKVFHGDKDMRHNLLARFCCLMLYFEPSFLEMPSWQTTNKGQEDATKHQGDQRKQGGHDGEVTNNGKQQWEVSKLGGMVPMGC